MEEFLSIFGKRKIKNKTSIQDIDDFGVDFSSISTLSMTKSFFKEDKLTIPEIKSFMTDRMTLLSSLTLPENEI